MVLCEGSRRPPKVELERLTPPCPPLRCVVTGNPPRSISGISGCCTGAGRTSRCTFGQMAPEKGPHPPPAPTLYKRRTHLWNVQKTQIDVSSLCLQPPSSPKPSDALVTGLYPLSHAPCLWPHSSDAKPSVFPLPLLVPICVVSLCWAQALLCLGIMTHHPQPSFVPACCAGVGQLLSGSKVNGLG